MVKLNKKCFALLIGIFVIFGLFFAIPTTQTTKVHALMNDTELEEVELHLNSGLVNTPYEQKIELDEFQEGYKYEIKYFLPYGLTFSDNGVISGTPLEPGHVFFYISLLDNEDSLVTRISASLVIASDNEYAFSQSYESSYNDIALDNREIIDTYYDFDNTYYEFNKFGQILYKKQENLDSMNTIINYYNEDRLLTKTIRSSYINKHFKNNYATTEITYDDQDRVLQQVNTNVSESRYMNTITYNWTYLENSKKSECINAQKNLMNGNETIVVVEDTYTTSGDTETRETIYYSDNKVTKSGVSRTITTPTSEETERWIVDGEDVRHTKYIITHENPMQETCINITYENGWEDSKTDTVVETERYKYETNVVDTENQNISTRKKYDNDNNLIETTKTISILSITNNNSYIITHETYRNDVLQNKSLDFQKFDKCIFNNKEALLYLLNDYNNNQITSNVLKANTDVVITLDEDLIIPAGLNIELNNVNLLKDKKIVLEEGSSLKILGDLMSGDKIIESNKVYSNKEEVYSEKSPNPLPLILIISCGALVLIGSCVTGIIIYKKKSNKKIA